jgi:aspartate aminotransferase
MSRGGGAATDLSRMARKIEVSPTVAMAARAAARKANGKEVLDFSVGEPDQPTPPHVIEAAERALEGGRTRYPAAAGISELRAAVGARYREDFGVSFTPEEIAITVGGKQALYLVCRALLDPGDEMLIPTPHWPTFSEAVRLAGARPALVATTDKDGFAVTSRLIARSLTPKTKAVLINSPSNPTGAVVAADELSRILALARRRKFTLIYDDTYAQLSYAAGGPVRLEGMREEAADRLVILGTASKTYCMTGWRIGWVLGPKQLADACAAFISHSTQGPATFAQVGAVEALNGPQGLVRDMCAEYRRRRDVMYPRLTGIPGVRCAKPEGAFYFFPNLSRCLTRAVPTTLALGLKLLDETGVATVPGEGFGAPGFLRISFARALPELEEGGRRIAAFLAGLQGR